MSNVIHTEKHPLAPFLPEGARILMLGSFPPKHERWSMEFFYPNWINDMWRIFGHIFFDDRNHFVVPGYKRFDRDKCAAFAADKGIAMFDTESEVRRLKDNASDNHLEIVCPTNVEALLTQLPQCLAIATTGEKATNELIAQYHAPKPKIGEATTLQIGTRNLPLYRMPSTSRAYPLSIDKKAAYYHAMFHDLGMLP